MGNILRKRKIYEMSEQEKEKEEIKMVSETFEKVKKIQHPSIVNVICKYFQGHWRVVICIKDRNVRIKELDSFPIVCVQYPGDPHYIEYLIEYLIDK